MNYLQFHRHQKGKKSAAHGKRDFFTRFANRTSRLAGSQYTFALAVLIIIVWAISGPLFRFSDTWQLVINTGTTIITFLMVFLIQNTQNRDSQALHLKIDALIVANRRARNILIEMEDMSQQELDAIKAKFTEIAEKELGDIQPNDWASYVLNIEQPDITADS